MKSEAIEELERRLQTDWAGMPEWAKEGLRQWTVAIENLPLSLPKNSLPICLARGRIKPVPRSRHRCNVGIA